jgi:hypothetical protein
MSICEIMDDIRENVDDFFKVRQVNRVITAKEITDNMGLEPCDTEED